MDGEAAVSLFPLTLTIPSPPRTKKNHGSVVAVRGKPVHLPSKAWMEWVVRASFFLHPVLAPYTKRKLLPIDKAVRLNCAATFYRDAARGDAVGYYQGLADLLEKVGVLANDVSLVSWDGSRLAKDADDPRTVVCLTLAED